MDASSCSVATDWSGSEDSRLSPRRLLGLTRGAVRLVWKASRRETVVLILLQGASGLVLPLQLLAGKWALDAVLEASRKGAGMSAALPEIAAALGALTVGQLLTSAARHRQRLLPELTSQLTQEMLAQKAVSLDLAALETPAFHDRLVRAQREAAFRPANMVRELTAILTSGVAVTGLILLLFTVHPVLVLLAAASVVPLGLASIAGGWDFYRHSVRRTPRRRQISYLQTILTVLDSAKETRAFGLGDYLVAEQRRLFDEDIAELRGIIRKRLRRDMLATLAGSIVSAGGLLLVLWLHFDEHISLAETAAAAGALLLMIPRLGGLVMSFGMLHENALFVEDLWSFLGIEQDRLGEGSAQGVPADVSTISVENLSFSYPDAPEPVLRDVSLEVRRGETVALVGENGAGKTTLAKLLCRLYDPSSGTIRWDGRDLASCDPDELRSRIAVIFQDFVHYQLTGRENVGFGDIGSIDDLDSIGGAARRAGADEFLTRLPDGYETTLGRMFEHGHELSIGQWQRVALARAFFRDAPLVIMDEPTASLDARAEYELFETMRELFRDRAVLLISHGFSSVRMADRIYVLDDGRVVQSGDHEELMAAGGLYAELFGLQAASYSRPR